MLGFEQVNAAWADWFVERNDSWTGTQLILKNGSQYHLLKFQKNGLPWYDNFIEDNFRLNLIY